MRRNTNNEMSNSRLNEIANSSKVSSRLKKRSTESDNKSEANNLTSTTKKDIKNMETDLTLFNVGFAKGASQVVTLNSYPNGVSVSIHKAGATINGIEHFSLRLKETRGHLVPEGRFYIYRENVKAELERLFHSLSKRPQWSSTVLYFGVFSDPFHGFHKKFNHTMTCMDIIERHTPGRVVVQSRSKMLLTALPLLKNVGKKGFAVIPFETCLESSIAKYTPKQSRLEERLVTSEGLRAQNVTTCLSASPILPYGETKGDTWKFAEVLTRYSDLVTLDGLYHGLKSEESSLRQCPLFMRLESDRQFETLRPNAHEDLASVIRKVAPAHLEIPPMRDSGPIEQLKLFAA
jgi:DNA repair photolyase